MSPRGGRVRRRTSFRGAKRGVLLRTLITDDVKVLGILGTKKMTIGLIQRLFRRKRKGWMSISEYRKRYERELKRNPRRFEREQEQARQWALRVANKNRAEEHRE